MSAKHVYRADETKQIESFLISIFDGTGSMYHEYIPAITAFFEVFGQERRGMKEYQFQFQSEVYDLLPYIGVNGYGGNITTTMTQVFNILLRDKDQLPKYITILFVGDGQESFDLNQLMPLILQMKQHFSISFISLAVGQHFPLEISNHLRLQLHNQDPNIQSTFLVERNRQRAESVVQQEFKEQFVKIKKLLTIQEGKLRLNQKVKQTIISQPSYEVIPDSVFYTEEETQIQYENGKTLQPSLKEEDVVQLIISSVQQAMIEQNSQNVQQQMQLIKQETESIIQNTPILLKEDVNVQNTKLIEVLELVDVISEGTLQINQITEDQKTKIQEALQSDQRSLKEEVIKYVDTVKNTKALTPKILGGRISEQYKKVKAGCYVKGKKQQYLSKLEQTEMIMKDTLSNCIQVMENNPQEDFVQLLTEFKNQTFISLNKVFKDQEFKIESQEQIVMLKQMNDLFELIHKVTINQVNPNDFISTVKARQNQQQMPQQNDIVVSAAIFDSNADFNYLPQELRLLVKEEIDLEEAEKLFILLVDQNPSMNQESDVAIQRFQQQFKDVPEDKKLIITWKEKQFYLHKDQNVQQQQQQQIIQGTKFDTLLKCLSSVEQELNLKSKRLFLCLVSDGETDYQTLHSEFKVAKFHYSIQFVYLAVGRKLFAKIENELRQKFANKNVKGAPELINIPRSLVVSTNAGQKIGEQFSQKFESLVKKITN